MVRLGAFLRGTFGPRLDPEAVRRVKEWTRQGLGATPETAIVVNEIACNDPACPGVETVVLVMEPGRKTRAYKVQKPVDDVTEPDIARALES
jgi:hypothetical protein